MDLPIRMAMKVGLVMALALASPEARADAIDGDWCHTDGRNFTISGPSIRTPRGTAWTGNYDRHGFSYVVPPGEPDPGQPISMRLMGEDTVILRAGGGEAPTQTWKRCRPGTS